jgi:hypothetical protein
MTNNIRERIKDKHNKVCQMRGGSSNKETNGKSHSELKIAAKLAGTATQEAFMKLWEIIQNKFRPLFNIYASKSGIFYKHNPPSEKNQRKNELITEIKSLKKNIADKTINSIPEDKTELDNLEKELNELNALNSEATDNMYMSVWASFIAFIKHFTEDSKDDNELTPQEKITKSRGKTYGSVPTPSMGAIQTLFRPFMVVGLIVGSVLTYILSQKKYVNELLEQKTDICHAIYQSQVYKNVIYNSPYLYYINTGLTPPVKEELCIRDYYVGCSYKSYLSCGYETIPTLKVIKPILNAGARVLHFDVFEDFIHSGDDASYIPMVRCATNDVHLGIPFHRIIEEIKNAEPFSKNADNPLIIYLDMWRQDENEVSTNNLYEGFKYLTSYETITAILLKHFGVDRLTIDDLPKYGYGGTRSIGSSIGDIKMYLAKGKVLLISNINPQSNYGGAANTVDKNNYTEGCGNLSKYLYGTVSYPDEPVPPPPPPPPLVVEEGEEPVRKGFTYKTKQDKSTFFNMLNIKNRTNTQKDPGMSGFIYDESLNNMSGIVGKHGGGLEDFKIYNTGNIRIVIPGISKKDNKYMWKNSLQNPNFLDCYQYGIQFVFINYQECLKETNNYIQFFKKYGKQFVVKRDDLRAIPAQGAMVPIQSKKLSLANRPGPKVTGFYTGHPI